MLKLCCLCQLAHIHFLPTNTNIWALCFPLPTTGPTTLLLPHHCHLLHCWHFFAGDENESTLCTDVSVNSFQVIPVGFYTMKILKTKTNFVSQQQKTQFICTDVALCFFNLYSNSNKANTAYGINFTLVLVKTGVTVISRIFSLAVILQ